MKVKIDIIQFASEHMHCIVPSMPFMTCIYLSVLVNSVLCYDTIALQNVMKNKNFKAISLNLFII